MKRFICKILILTMLALPYSLSAQAGMIATPGAAVERDTVSSLLARDDVQRSLAEFGVSPDEARKRVAAMTDDEARSLAGNVADAPAGGIIGLLLIVLLVILIVKVAR